MFIPSFNVLCDSAYMYIFMCDTEHNNYFIMTFYADFLYFCYRMASAESLASVTAQEKLLLHTYSVKLPQPIIRDCEAAIDNTAVAILKLSKPGLLDNHTPLSVVGDGNCLSRSISLALYGNEDKHMLLRLLTALEIADNPDYYKPPPPHISKRQLIMMSCFYLRVPLAPT